MKTSFMEELLCLIAMVIIFNIVLWIGEEIGFKKGQLAYAKGDIKYEYFTNITEEVRKKK